MKAWLAALGLLALVATAPAAAVPNLGSGGTTATVDGTSVTITVNIDLCCFDAYAREIFGPLVLTEIKAAQDMWNEALANLPAFGCWDVKVVFNAHLLNKEQAWEAGYHQITMELTKPGRSGSQDPRATSATEDSDTVYVQPVTGQFYDADMNTEIWAHEIGHLMGLGDDYYENHVLGHAAGSCLPARDGTLMCDGDKIDQQLADRLVQILNQDGVVRGQCWKGTMLSVTNMTTTGFGVTGTCTGETWQHQLKLTVAGDGTVSGVAVSKMIAMPKITWSAPLPLPKGYMNIDHEAKTSKWNIKGHLNDKQFELEFFEAFIDGATSCLLNYTLFNTMGAPAIIVPLTGVAKASGETDVARANMPYTVGTTASARHTVDLECTTCELPEH